MSKDTCKTCCLWANEDPYNGKADENYCIVKPLYTFTDPDHECDEMMLGGGYYYSKQKDNKQ